MAERLLAKEKVAGSSPVRRSPTLFDSVELGLVAQLAPSASQAADAPDRERVGKKKTEFFETARIAVRESFLGLVAQLARRAGQATSLGLFSRVSCLILRRTSEKELGP